ncbi:hypothetical protein GC194_08610 [bacterium]|nr:hypothetical protein [bacterium]
MKTKFLLLALSVWCCSCMPAIMVGSVPCKQTAQGFVFDNQSVELLQNDELQVWSEVDMRYNGALVFELVLEVYCNDEIIYTQKCDPRFAGPRFSEKLKVQEGIIHYKYSSENVRITAHKDGNYTVKAAMVVTGNGNIQMNKYDLSLKVVEAG